jgi:invasion protein IalB
VTIEKTTAVVVVVTVVAEMAMATVAVAIAAVVAVVPSQTTDAVTANGRVTGQISASDKWKGHWANKCQRQMEDEREDNEKKGTPSANCKGNLAVLRQSLRLARENPKRIYKRNIIHENNMPLT